MMWDGHWREMMGWGFFPWAPLHMLLSLIALALFVAFLVSLFSPGRHHPQTQGDRREGMGLAILEERYVRGEIDREEFMQKKRDLIG